MTPLLEAIEIRHYRLPLDPPFHASWDPRPRTHHTTTLVRVRAGEYEGVGAGDAMLGFAGHESLFLGQDPFAIERHVHLLDNLQFHYGRMWPLELALWDLMGQISGLPLWQMLGGRTPHVRPYASTGSRLPPAARAESAQQLQAMGFPALKIRFHAADVRQDIAVVQAVRQAVGAEMEILVDANQGWQMPWDAAAPWDFKTALWVADALAELGVYWLEEPLHRHDFHGLAALRQRTKVRIAGGEGNREFAELRQYLQHGSLDVYQPDVVWSTGILRGRDLAKMAQAAGAIYSPHSWGDGLVLLANLHVAAAVSTAPFIEYPYDPPGWTPERRDFILPEPIYPDANGLITLSSKPGLGVTLEWDRLAEFQVDPPGGKPPG
ncbi:MAG: mandelate racemase/muconate lactonizing enzyme family protein [Anaerolineae bacterium]|nr:mandelate racemase/muconate lactonizing enzyme family protein [Anaerolineae bacterium]